VADLSHQPRLATRGVRRRPVFCGPIPRVGEAFDRLAPLAYGYEANDLLDDATVDRAGNVTAVTVPWAVAGNKVHREWENTSLGTIEIDGRLMTVSVNSEQRARKIRGLLAKRLGGVAGREGAGAGESDAPRARQDTRRPRAS